MTKNLLFSSLLLASSLAVLVLFPGLHLGLVALNLCVHLLVVGAQFVASRFSAASIPPVILTETDPFVSVIVPAHNEPPEVLRLTLISISKLRWSAFEVLVVDNNTSDESIWRPIEALCRRLGPRFRFFHWENVVGAKAGALNRIMQEVSPASGYVFIVDADYILERDALRRAVGRANSPSTGLVQFPQEYRNTCPGNLGIALDFRHFFAGYMNVAQRLGAVPCTGTLSLVRVEALKDVGGFNPGVVTEDADLGLRLNSHGWDSVYVNEVTGRGLIPHDLESLKKQRWRWSFGNAQILKLNWQHFLLRGRLTALQRLGYLLHLTAWFNFNLLPSISLVLLAPLALAGMWNPLQPYIVVLSGFTLVSYLALRFGTMFYSLRDDGLGCRQIWKAFLSHLGMGWVFGASWVKCIWDHRQHFVRTNKFLGGNPVGALAHTFSETCLGSLLVVSALIYATTDFVLGPIAALMMALARFLVHWVGWQTSITRAVTEGMARDVRQSFAARKA